MKEYNRPIPGFGPADELLDSIAIVFGPVSSTKERCNFSIFQPVTGALD